MDQQRVETTTFSLKDAPPTPPDRRSSERYLSLLRVGTVTLADRQELCLVRNISSGGMMIRAYSDIHADARLSIELKQGEPISGIVRWVENGLTGVTFDEPIDVLSLLSLNFGAQRQRIPRIELECSGWVSADGDSQPVRVLNISPGGICVEATRLLVPDTDVVVTLIGLAPAAAVVKWAKDGTYGIGFNRKLPLPELVEWLRAQQEKMRALA